MSIQNVSDEVKNLKLINLQWAGVKAWTVSILENEIHAVLLDSGWDKWNLFENEEINEGDDLLVGEGSVQDFKG